MAVDSEEEEGGHGAGASTRAEVGSSVAGSRQAGASAGSARGGRCVHSARACLRVAFSFIMLICQGCRCQA